MPPWRSRGSTAGPADLGRVVRLLPDHRRAKTRVRIPQRDAGLRSRSQDLGPDRQPGRGGRRHDEVRADASDVAPLGNIQRLMTGTAEGRRCHNGRVSGQELCDETKPILRVDDRPARRGDLGQSGGRRRKREGPPAGSGSGSGGSRRCHRVHRDLRAPRPSASSLVSPTHRKPGGGGRSDRRDLCPGLEVASAGSIRGVAMPRSAPGCRASPTISFATGNTTSEFAPGPERACASSSSIQVALMPWPTSTPESAPSWPRPS